MECGVQITIACSTEQVCVPWRLVYAILSLHHRTNFCMQTVTAAVYQNHASPLFSTGWNTYTVQFKLVFWWLHYLVSSCAFLSFCIDDGSRAVDLKTPKFKNTPLQNLQIWITRKIITKSISFLQIWGSVLKIAKKNWTVSFQILNLRVSENVSSCKRKFLSCRLRLRLK